MGDEWGTMDSVMLDWGPLEGVIEGEVALPGSRAYEASRGPFNARFHELEPKAIVSCATPQDVSEAISFGRRHGLDVAMRSGGHSFAGHSSSRGVVLDVTPMRSVSVSGSVATVGAGARLGDVYEALQEHGLAIPAGTCPSVGVAGLTLGGGLGILGRRYGVTSDHLVGAEIVLADGRILKCDEHHDEDLFWALRGAGAGNFGVVTSLVFRTVPAPDATNVHVAWPFSRAASVIEAWQSWAPNGPDELAVSLKVTATGDVDRPPSVDVYGALLVTESDAANLINELVTRAGSDPISWSQEHMSFPKTRRFWAQLGEAEQEGRDDAIAQPSEPVYLFSKSEFFRRPLPAEAVAALMQTFSQGRAPGQSRELDFMPWGGAYNRVRPDATAFVHRDELFQLKHAVVVQPDASTGENDAAHRQVARSWGSVHPWGSGRVFQNFADPDLEDWAEAYYGPNLDRLVRVKTRYDPMNVFRFDQSLQRFP
jgi:FAD/FMN-containing dehydrogenase